jgi:hypothetical protein
VFLETFTASSRCFFVRANTEIRVVTIHNMTSLRIDQTERPQTRPQPSSIMQCMLRLSACLLPCPASYIIEEGIPQQPNSCF